ncbi:MAG: tetratricopeptide repeat protein [Spirochaetes bacterium]|nr:tetratricopeptide repeat protein [Spirochaetota bacterium]
MKKILILSLALCFIVNLYGDDEDHQKRARVFLKNKQYDKAIEEYTEAIKQNPGFTEGYYKIGLIYEQFQKDFFHAIKYYLKYMEKGGEKSEDVRTMVKNIANLRHETTDEEYNEIKKGVNYYNQGVQSGKKGKFQKAIDWFKKSLEIIPHYAKAHYSLGMALFNEKSYKTAYNHLLYAVKVDPDNQEMIEAYFKLGLLSDDIFLGDYRQAVYFYQQYVEKEGSFKRKAERLLQSLEQVNEFVVSSAEFFQNKDYSKAKEKLNLASGLRPNDPRIINNLGIIDLAQDNFENSIHQFKKAIQLKNDFGDAYYNIACAYSKKGDNKEALAYFKKGLKYFSPELVEKAKSDEDLKNLRKDKEFQKLLKKSSPK